MTARTVESSPQFYARIAGFLYLIIIAGGLFAQVFVLDRLVVRGDPSASVTNILEHEMLFRSGFVVHIIILLCALGVLSVLFQLFKRVNTDLAVLMVFFNLVSITIEAVSILGHYAPLVILKNAHIRSTIPSDHVEALVTLSLRLQSVGYDLGLIFFGFFCIVVGYLIVRSALLPGTIGVLMVIAGVCYPVNSFIHFLAPQHSLFPYIVIPCFVAELLLCLWLLVKGVNITGGTAAFRIAEKDTR